MVIRIDVRFVAWLNYILPITFQRIVTYSASDCICSAFDFDTFFCFFLGRTWRSTTSFARDEQPNTHYAAQASKLNDRGRKCSDITLTHQDLVVFRIARVDLPFELERRISVLLFGTRQRVVLGTVLRGNRVPDTMPILRRRWAEHSRHFTTPESDFVWRGGVLIINLRYDQTDGTCTPFQSKRLYLQPSD